MARTANPHPESKEKLLSAAQQLMLEKGFAGTTVDEICEEAGLTKGSFFHYFESKEDITKAAMDRFSTGQMTAIRGAPGHAEADPLKRIYATLDFIGEMAKDPRSPRSCLIGNITQELAETNPELRSECHGHLCATTEMFEKDLAEAKQKYKPRSDIDARSLAEHLVAVIQGSLLIGKAKAEKEKLTLQKNVRHFKAYVKYLFEE